MQHATDKITIDCSTPEEQDLNDQFARMEPGDQVSGSFVAKLDEFQNKIAILSIDNITVKATEEEAPENEDAETETPETEPASSAASVALFKGKEV